MAFCFWTESFKSMTDKELLLSWEFLWEHHEKVFSKVLELSPSGRQRISEALEAGKT